MSLMAVAILTAAVGLAYDYSKQELNVGVVLPYTAWRKREYQKNIRTTVTTINKMNNSFSFMEKYQLTTPGVHMDMLRLSASPTSKMQHICYRQCMKINPRPTGGGLFRAPLSFSCDIF